MANPKAKTTQTPSEAQKLYFFYPSTHIYKHEYMNC